MHRRQFLWRGGAALALAGCAQETQRALAPGTMPDLVLPRPRVSADRIIKITVCSRPFRAQGPRIEVEQIGDKTVVHNYGHGGSGWSLSWGSSTIATRLALAGGPRRVGVIGCGALGLTSALLLQRAGTEVTIYAKELPPETRSTFATGSWTPDSRICLADQATPAFKQLWTQMARTSFLTYSNYLGLPGAPVEWIDSYDLTDVPFEQARESKITSAIRFADLQRELIPDLISASEDLPAGKHPFKVPYLRRFSNMMFNLTTYQHLLITDFLADGGRIERREFHAPSEFAALPQPVLINATGYGARALMGDESIVPVRGQLARLIPDPDVHYGLLYRYTLMLPRRDGVLIQAFGADEAQGYNDASIEPDRADVERAVATIGSAVEGMRAS